MRKELLNVNNQLDPFHIDRTISEELRQRQTK